MPKREKTPTHFRKEGWCGTADWAARFPRGAGAMRLGDRCAAMTTRIEALAAHGCSWARAPSGWGECARKTLHPSPQKRRAVQPHDVCLALRGVG